MSAGSFRASPQLGREGISQVDNTAYLLAQELLGSMEKHYRGRKPRSDEASAYIVGTTVESIEKVLDMGIPAEKERQFVQIVLASAEVAFSSLKTRRGNPIYDYDNDHELSMTRRNGILAEVFVRQSLKSAGWTIIENSINDDIYGKVDVLAIDPSGKRFAFQVKTSRTASLAVIPEIYPEEYTRDLHGKVTSSLHSMRTYINRGGLSSPEFSAGVNVTILGIVLPSGNNTEIGVFNATGRPLLNSDRRLLTEINRYTTARQLKERADNKQRPGTYVGQRVSTIVY